MNYRHIYCKIISYAKSQNRVKGGEIYYEAHHILPKSLFTNWRLRKSNIVLLTPCEHFFCHQLLTKIYPCSEMIYAYFLMSHNGKYKVTSRDYERSKVMMGEMKRHQVITDEQRAKISKALKGRKITWDTSHEVIMTEETRQKIKKAAQERAKSAEWRKKISETSKGRRWTAEQKRKASESHKNPSDETRRLLSEDASSKRWYNNGEKETFSRECPEGWNPGRLFRKRAKHKNKTYAGKPVGRTIKD